MTVNVPWNVEWAPFVTMASQVILAQMEVWWNTVKIMSQLNPLLKSASDTFHQAISDLKSQLHDYDTEENLISTNPLFNVFNGLNPYHTFLEWQKARKLFFESALVDIHVFQTLFPFQAPLLQQMENFIRTNLAFTFTFHRPDWNLDFAHEEVEEFDFMKLVKFPAPKENPNGRNMLLVAPMSGHFSTLLRKTIESLHNEWYTVFITDWKSPFDVPKEKGDFTIDRYTQEILNAYKSVSENVWVFDVLAVCQPSPETMTATAYAEANNLAKPRSIALMAWPIDVSKSPTAVNQASLKLTPDVINALSSTIPKWKEQGSSREVYPAALQIMSFIMTKPQEHMGNFRNLAYKTTAFTVEEEKMLSFYREYFAIMDLPHEFYDETVRRVFRWNEWANGKVNFQWTTVDFSQMKTPLVTIEWERDDICWIGQTSAAHTIAPNTEWYRYILVLEAGHYGTFAGKWFRWTVLPALDKFYSSLAK
jgi:poly(3-hydroxybutyrate) depolymerase